jgi:hypothetical protein
MWIASTEVEELDEDALDVRVWVVGFCGPHYSHVNPMGHLEPTWSSQEARVDP